MRSKKLIVYTVLLALVTVFSCNDETTFKDVHPDNDGDKVVKLNFKYAPARIYNLGSDEEASTKTGPEWGVIDDLRVRNVHVFQYAKDSEVLVTHNYVEVPDGEEDVLVKLGGDDGTIYDVYYLVNWGENINKSKTFGADYYTAEELNALTRSNLTSATFCKIYRPNYETGLPSTGVGVATIHGTQFEVSVNLKAMVARLDVTVKLGDAMKLAFDINSIEVNNVEIWAMPFTEPEGTYPSSSSGTYKSPPVNKTNPNFPSYFEQVTYTIFIPENHQGTMSTTITTPEGKNHNYAPLLASYITVEGFFDFPGADYQGLKYEFYPGANDIDDFNINRNTRYNITLNLTGNKYAADGRISTTTSYPKPTTYHSSTRTCKLCYEGQPTYLNLRDLVTSNEVFAVNVLWRDNSSMKINIKTFDTNIYKIIPEGGVGNAMIEVKNSTTGERVRQYHIWVVDKAQNVFDAEHDVMFLNLGATSSDVTNNGNKGLLYQWGRPYPMPGSKSFDPNAGSQGEMLVYKGKEYDDRLIIEKDILEDYTYNGYLATFSSLFSDYFISTDQGTDFPEYTDVWDNDPCPQGWKIPTSDEAVATLDGLEFSTGATYYKYGDYKFNINCGRFDQYFVFLDTGVNTGFYWLKDTKTAFNFLDESHIVTDFTMKGYPVRCIKESFVAPEEPTDP